MVSLGIIYLASKRRSRQSNEMVNLFGVSIFSVRLYKLIILAEAVNMVIMIWHPVMMYVNLYLINNTPADPNSNRDTVTIGTLQGFLVAFVQIKKILDGWIDLNILFEIISLVHLIVTEEGMSVQQILFTIKQKGHHA